MLVRLLTVLVVIAFCLMVVIIIRYPHYTYKTLPVPLEEHPQPERYSEWRVFYSAIGEFEVLMPGQPQHAVEKLPIPNTALSLDYNMYVAEEIDGTTAMVSMITYPQQIDTSNNRAMLESIMNEMVSSDPGNTLRLMQFSTFQGYPSLDFKIQNQDVIILSKTFMVGKKLFLLSLIDKTGNFQEEEFSHFISSFKFVQAQ